MIWPMWRAQVPVSGNLGRLTEVVIGHDNAGDGAPWHLEQVDVVDPSGKVRGFCGVWPRL